MNHSMFKFQRGISIEGVAVGAFLLVIFSIVGLKLIPPYMDNKAIQNIFVILANDPDLKQSSPLEIQMAYNRRASIDNITAIPSSDIDIFNDGGDLYLSAEYEVKIPLFSNISFLLEFSPSSEQ